MTDNQIKRAKPYAFHSLSACAGCGCSGEDFGSVNVEAFTNLIGAYMDAAPNVRATE